MRLISCLVIMALALPAVAHAEDAAVEGLARKSGCSACHGVEKKIVGPAFKDIAAKYNGDKTAEAKLIEKVKKGGSGVWGPMPMPANSPQVKDEDIKTLVEWVLAH